VTDKKKLCFCFALKSKIMFATLVLKDVCSTLFVMVLESMFFFIEE
jgi:hypothetical protein